jgi:hypothetical protein
VGRARTGAAVVLVAVLAVAWLTTSRMGNGPGAADAAPASPSAGADATSAPTTTSGVDGVEVNVRRMRPAAVGSAYLAAIGIGSAPHTVGHGDPACSRGGEEERAWSLPAQPRVAVGRYACRIEQGRAAMWWTVADRGLLAHAIAADADLASLFAWWESHSER